MRGAITIYVGVYDEYVIPDELVKRAAKLNAGKPLADRRTKGARLLNWWGRNQDAEQETIRALHKHFPESVRVQPH